MDVRGRPAQKHSTRPANRLGSLAAVAFLAITIGACGRPSTSSGPAPGSQAAAATPHAKGAPGGDFGDLKKICGPGNAKGATARGVTDSDIRIGVSADPGNVSAPGLGQEFFDVGEAFTKWCNAAGGINGRKIVLDKYDAKLFEAAAQIVSACQKDLGVAPLE